MFETDSNLCYLNFKAKFHTAFNEQVKIIGSAVGLGNWNPPHALCCITEKDFYPWWVSKKPLCVRRGDLLEFKIITFNESTGNVRWETIENRIHVPNVHRATLELCENDPKIKSYVLEEKHPKLEEIKHQRRSAKNPASFDPFKIAAESEGDDDQDSIFLNSQSSVFKLGSNQNFGFAGKFRGAAKTKDLKMLYKEIFFLRSQKVCK
jgi:hypothetical protein